MSVTDSVEEKVDGMMSKNQLINNITVATGIPKATVESVLTALAGEVNLALSSGETIVVPRIGSFSMNEYVARRPERRTGKSIERVACFTPARSLKQTVNL